MNGHNGPLFLPWHRQFLLLFEDALREVSGRKVTVPYWDTSSQESTRSVLSNDFMGGDGDPNHGWALMTGPFSADQWNGFPVRNEGAFWGRSATTHITRHMGSHGAPLPPYTAPNTPESVAATMSRPRYDVAPYDDSSDDTYSFRNALEGWAGDRGTNPFDVGPSRAYCSADGWIVVPIRRPAMHNYAHAYIGGVVGMTSTGATVAGTMAAVPASPNDPIFFLLHANVDRLWALWQDGREGDPAARFPTDSVNPFDAPEEKMQPFAADGRRLSPRQVDSIAELGYRYDPPVPSPASVALHDTSAGDESSSSSLFCKIPDVPVRRLAKPASTASLEARNMYPKTPASA